MTTFKNTHLSVSRLKKYEQCSLSFYFQYVNKGPTEARGMAAVFGVVLHEALEMTFKWIMENEYEGLFPTDTLIGAYQEAWRSSREIDGVELYREGLLILRAYAERHPTVDHMQILAVEQEFNLRVGEFTLNGYIDRIEKMGSDGVLIVDYKSSRSLYTRSELESDLQAATYLLVAKELYPWAKRIAFAFDMLRHNTRQSAERSLDEIEDTRGYLLTLGRKTETDTEWKPRLNDLCGWCDHRGRCGEYKQALAGGREMAKIASLEGVEEIAAEREAVARLAKMMYGRKESLDKLLKAKIAQDGEFVAAGVKYRLVNNFDTSYPDAEKVVRAFVECGLEAEDVRSKIVGVIPSAVKALQEGTKLDRSRAMLLDATLAAVAVKTPGSPRIDARAEKKSASKQRADDIAKEALVGNPRIAGLQLDEDVFE